MTIQEQLTRYPALHSEVLAMFKRLEELEESDRTVDLGECDRISCQITANQNEMLQLVKMIDNLDHPREREVLRLRYTDGTNGKTVRWKEVCLKLYGGSEEKHLYRAYTLHRKALDHIQQQMKNRAEIS